jgi:hypothetical protein
MDYKNTRMWTLNNITSIEDDSCGIHPNKTNTI